MSEQIENGTKTFNMDWFLPALKNMAVPMIGILLFLGVWQVGAPKIETSLGAVPGPTQVFQQFLGLIDEHQEARAKADAFIERQEVRNAAKLEKDPNAVVKIRPCTGKASFFDQILTSLFTVITGFVIASLIAIPIGIVAGLSQTVYSAINPLIQIFKPVSPLAWLPIVTIIVSAVYVSDNPMFEKAFVTSAITVMLCCLWPTLINTVVGVANISQDLQNVSKVLRLSWWTHVVKIVLPSAIPMIFTGLRLSFGIAWMVLIAAEMLAQNPGLGKFVWDEFQNGSSNSLGRIMVAVIVIGVLGYLLDRGMLVIQKYASWDKTQALR